MGKKVNYFGVFISLLFLVIPLGVAWIGSETAPWHDTKYLHGIVAFGQVAPLLILIGLYLLVNSLKGNSLKYMFFQKDVSRDIPNQYGVKMKEKEIFVKGKRSYLILFCCILLLIVTVLVIYFLSR